MVLPGKGYSSCPLLLTSVPEAVDVPIKLLGSGDNGYKLPPAQLCFPNYLRQSEKGAAKNNPKP